MKRLCLLITWCLTITAMTQTAQGQAPVSQSNIQELWIENGSRHIYGELFTPQNIRK